MTTSVARMIQRSDTTAGWAAENPVLADGELGWDSDLKQLKIGDGTAAWSSLPWFAPGGGGSAAVSGFYFPETYGAVGDGVTDDTEAVQAAYDDASAAGGGIVLLSKAYGWRGDLLHKQGVTVWGVQMSAFGVKENGLIALDGTARYRFGIQAGNPYVGELANVLIDGAEVGGTTELVRVEAVEGVMRDVVVVRGINDGVYLANSQNCSLEHVSVGYFPNGSAIRIGNNDALAFNGQGAGGNKITNSYFHTALRLFHIDYEVKDSAAALGFWAHDNIFTGCLFEQYQDDVECLGRISDGETRFSNCVFTGSSGMLTTTEDCVILVENDVRTFEILVEGSPTYVSMPTYATFDSCDFGAGAVAKSCVLRSASYGTTNAIRLYGKTTVNNDGSGAFLGNDIRSKVLPHSGATSTGLGSIGGVFGALDGVAGASGVGTAVSAGFNGGIAGVWANEQRQPIRYLMDADQGSPIQVRRSTDSTNRYQVDRDGVLRWLDGSSSATIANITRVGQIMALGGTWGFNHGLIRAYAVQFISADTTATIDPALANTQVFSFGGAYTLTSLTVGAGAEGQELRIVMFGPGTITWPSNMTPHPGTTLPQPTAGAYTFIDFQFIGGSWREQNRSGGSGGGGGVTMAEVAQLVQWAKVPDSIITGTITRNVDDVVTSADVVWPDGTTGTFTTDTIGPLDTIDAYHITYDGAPALTFTQPLITRNANGAATNVPAITVA